MQKMDDHDKVLGSRMLSISKLRESGSPRLVRRPSLVGPSVAVGIATMSASDVSDLYGCNNTGSQNMMMQFLS